MTEQATWGIPTRVRGHIRRGVLELRRMLEDDFQRQLIALGIIGKGTQALPQGRTLNERDARARELAGATIAQAVEAGASQQDAFDSYVRDAAFTFINRVVGLRCLDERGLLLVDGHAETAIRSEAGLNASTLYWRVRNELPPGTSPRDLWRETLRRAGDAIGQRVRVLFDPASEYAALFPLPQTLQRVAELLNAPEIPGSAWAEDEVLGWVYQYYNADEKDAVYAKLGKGKKFERPEDIIAATCLYTERYMVDYLLQNTLGRLWVELHPQTRLPEQWPYYVRPPEGNPPVERAPQRVRDITLLDPACGGGHFLVRAFELFAQLYAEEGIERSEDVPALILERNLHGIDIDLRAIQIAAFGLYLKGCALAGPEFRPTRINLISADVALPEDALPAQAYLRRFNNEPEMLVLVDGVWKGLHNVRELGSLLHPERAIDEVVRRRRARDRGGLFEHDDAQWELWKTDLLSGLREEFERQAGAGDLGQHLFGEHLARSIGLVEALGRRYDVVVANPPYAGSKSFNPDLKQFIDKEYKEGKRDLYAAFILRCLDFTRPGGQLGMVTMQSWMFLRTSVALRSRVLDGATIHSIVQMGARAFEEISGEVVSTAMFTLSQQRPQVTNRLAGIRLTGVSTAFGKQSALRVAMASESSSTISTSLQRDLRTIPESPFAFWIRPRFFSLLQSSRRLSEWAEVKQGLATADDERFTRCFWEVASVGHVDNNQQPVGRWFWLTKGGGQLKWAGLEWLVVDWENDGFAIRTRINPSSGRPYSNVWMLKDTADRLFFRNGLTYSTAAHGNMAARQLDSSIFSHKSCSIFAISRDDLQIQSLLNSRVSSYLLRVMTQNADFSNAYVANLPLPMHDGEQLAESSRIAMSLALRQVVRSKIERRFACLSAEREAASSSLKQAISHGDDESFENFAALHTVEGVNEWDVASTYALDADDEKAIVSELGSPSGWNCLIEGYDRVPLDIVEFWNDAMHSNRIRLDQIRLSPEELSKTKRALREHYVSGATATVDHNEETPDEREHDALDHDPVPPGSFLEELADRVRLHPITVLHLLLELRREGYECTSDVNRQLTEFAEVAVVRMLGYRWPEQDAYEAEHGAILDPDLVDEGGIIPLVQCADQPVAVERVRMRLERQFGVEGALQSEQEFKRWVGKDLETWLRRDFFKHHIQQFKQRPIAWHLSSPEGTFQAFILYHKLGRPMLQQLRAQYAGELVARLRGEQARARDRGDDKAAGTLQRQIDDVTEFIRRIELIERGDELPYRIRCRWKGEEETGRPGPYDFDINDGVKVNIRPFQEAGVLSVKTVIKKW